MSQMLAINCILPKNDRELRTSFKNNWEQSEFLQSRYLDFLRLGRSHGSCQNSISKKVASAQVRERNKYSGVFRLGPCPYPAHFLLIPGSGAQSALHYQDFDHPTAASISQMIFPRQELLADFMKRQTAQSVHCTRHERALSSRTLKSVLPYLGTLISDVGGERYRL